jgi:hypothetical protein
MEFNPGRFEKSALVKHYTAQQLGKFQEGGNTLAKALKIGAAQSFATQVAWAPRLSSQAAQ